MDSGSKRSIICIRKSLLYTDHINFKLELSPKVKEYNFRNNRSQGLCTVILRMPVANSHLVHVVEEVVSLYVPFLLVLDVMSRFKLFIYFYQ